MHKSTNNKENKVKKNHIITVFNKIAEVRNVIGLIGGMSIESSEHYKDIIFNKLEEANSVGRENTILVEAVFDLENQIKPLMDKGDWDKVAELMINAANNLKQQGAKFIVIATNTIHKVADIVEKEINIPLLHIADSTAEVIKQSGLKKVGLLGTNFTMREDFYKARLVDKYGLEVEVPLEKDCDKVHDIIFKELIHGKTTEESRQEYIRIMRAMGCDGVILGCTEIGMLVKQQDVPEIKLFDTADIHAQAAYRASL